MFCAMLAFTTIPVGQTSWAQEFCSWYYCTLGNDMFFPSGTIILSNAMQRAQQGLAVSLVPTTVNYSISLGLGFSGTLESRFGGCDSLKGYRGALCLGTLLGHWAWALGLGTGLASLGLVMSVFFILTHWRGYRKPH